MNDEQSKDINDLEYIHYKTMLTFYNYSKESFINYKDLQQFNCVKCGVNTLEIFEYYMLKDHVWKLAGIDKGMLCITCFETKTNITLNKSHFTDYPLNTEPFMRSKLLQKRIDS